jgi:hypothetical protein
MSDLRSREEILESLQGNLRALTKDVGLLGQSIQEKVSPVGWARRNPLAAVVVGAGALAIAIMFVRAGRSRLFRVVAGGAASAVGSVFAAQAGRWVRDRVAERVQPAEPS